MRRYIQLIGNDFAPYINIEVHHVGSQKSAFIQMMVDTGSSRTVLPIEVLKRDLKASPREMKSFRDFNDKQHILPIFTVNLIIEGTTFIDIDALGTKNPHYGLIGRDILSHYFLRCDGRAQRFELEYQI